MYWLVSNADDCDDSYNMAAVRYLYNHSLSILHRIGPLHWRDIHFFWSLNFINTYSLHLNRTTPPHPQGVISHHKPLAPSGVGRLLCSSLALSRFK
jgi:hypothetical protein